MKLRFLLMSLIFSACDVEISAVDYTEELSCIIAPCRSGYKCIHGYCRAICKTDDDCGESRFVCCATDFSDRAYACALYDECP